MSNDALLVAIGAVPGAWLRFRVVNHLEPMIPRKHWGTFGVNVIACFVLGLVVSLEQSCSLASSRLLLLIGTGFLGSFSTFSSFMAELFVVLQARAWGQSFWLVASSVVGGLAAMELGLALGAG